MTAKYSLLLRTITFQSLNTAIDDLIYTYSSALGYENKDNTTTEQLVRNVKCN